MVKYRMNIVQSSAGYRLVYLPGHRNADNRGYVYEHTLMMSQHLGRPLHRGEVVHHLNKDKGDNRLENLQLFPNNREHKLFHHYGSCDRPPYTEREWLYERYIVKNMSTLKIAEEAKVSNQAIRSWLKKTGIPIRSISDSLKALYSNGYVQPSSKIHRDKIPYILESMKTKTLRQIADEIGCDFTSIHRRLKAWGVDYTPKHPEKRTKKWAAKHSQPPNLNPTT